jgi:hypothetical protein
MRKVYEEGGELLVRTAPNKEIRFGSAAVGKGRIDAVFFGESDTAHSEDFAGASTPGKTPCTRSTTSRCC